MAYVFSLLVGLNDGFVSNDRLLERTDPIVKERLGPDYVSTLPTLPTLSMPEEGDSAHPQVAKIGSATKLRPASGMHRFTFLPNPEFPTVPVSTIHELASELGIRKFELTRTHWAVKDVDLFEVLFKHYSKLNGGCSPEDQASGAVSFPKSAPRDPSLVAVMMPLAPRFDVVYETISAAAADVDLTCVRADDIWENDHVMGDILSLLWRAQIVVADLTDRRANVFYEAGLAHALPRDTVLITQRSEDVPFDLQSIRHLRYGLSTEGRAVLRTQLAERFATLMTKVGE